MSFKLVTVERIVPNMGETLGDDLDAAAEVLASKEPREFWGPRAATLYRLAADAFDLASGVTIGHHRGERYRRRARDLREAAAEAEKT